MIPGRGAIGRDSIARSGSDDKESAPGSSRLLLSGDENPDGTTGLALSGDAADESAADVKFNRPAVTYVGLSVQAQIADFREKVRGNNVLETVYRDDLLTALAQLEEDVQELLRLVSVDNGSAQPSTQGTVRGWLAEYSTHCQRLLGELLTPKNMAQASVPAGLTTALMGLGYAVDGAGGSFVGMVFGRYLLGDLSFGAATEKAFRHMSAQSAVKSDAETNRPKGDEPDNS